MAIVILLAAGGAVGADHFTFGWDGYRYHSPQERYRIGLALSGGGARGLAQIGVLRALEENDFEIAAIAGTSIGGIVGGLYAAGYPADSLEKLIGNIDFSALFSNRPPRTSMFTTQRPEKERYLVSIRFDGFHPYIPQALTSGQQLSDLLTRLTIIPNYLSGADFSRLQIPFRAVTTDIVTGREEVLSGGNLSTAMRATMAFPLAFTGVEYGDRLLMDGGIVNPIPVTAIPENNPRPDLIIAVNTTSDLLTRDMINDPIDIANQITSIMSLDRLAAGMAAADLIITPDIERYLSTDFADSPELIDRGYQATLALLPEIRRRLAKRTPEDSLVVASVVFPDLPPGMDRSGLTLRAGDIVDRRDIEKSAGDLYRANRLLSLTVTLHPADPVPAGYTAYHVEFRAVGEPVGDRTEIRITGNQTLADSTIRTLLTSGRRLSADSFRDFSDSLKQLYRERGLDLAHVRRLVYDRSDNRLDIDIDEGLIEAVEITGNHRTKGWLIKSHLPIEVGQPFNSRAVSDGLSNIFGTDLFDRVTLNVVPGRVGAVIMISVDEKKYAQLRLGWHWHDEYDSEEFAELLDDNLFGTGQELLVHAQYSDYREKYALSLKADRFFSTYLTYRIKAYYHLLDRKYYDRQGAYTGRIHRDRRGLQFILGQQIHRLGTVTGEIRWEETRNTYSTDGHRERIKFRTVTIRSLVETINKIPFPTEGKKHEFYIEFATDILGGQTRYTRSFSSVESYFPLTGIFNIHPRLAFGWTDSDQNVPISEKFYIGGYNSFYGYRTDELVGDKLIIGSLDLRLKLPYNFYLTARYDIGDVYGPADDIKLNSLRHGYGFELAYATLLGPLRLAYGDVGDRSGRVYVNAGFEF